MFCQNAIAFLQAHINLFDVMYCHVRVVLCVTLWRWYAFYQYHGLAIVYTKLDNTVERLVFS